MTAESELALRLELLVMRVSLQDIECTGNLQREGRFSQSFMQLQATEVRSVCVCVCYTSNALYNQSLARELLKAGRCCLHVANGSTVAELHEMK